jgi:ferrous iron transport protein A
MKEKIIKLSELSQGQKGIINHYEPTNAYLHLLELGCVPGENIIIENIAPLGDPISIQIAGYTLSLRKSDAEIIWVKI